GVAAAPHAVLLPARLDRGDLVGTERLAAIDARDFADKDRMQRADRYGHRDPFLPTELRAQPGENIELALVVTDKTHDDAARSRLDKARKKLPRGRRRTGMASLPVAHRGRRLAGIFLEKRGQALPRARPVPRRRGRPVKH